MKTSSLRLGRTASLLLSTAWLLWIACSSPPTLSPQLTSACSSNADCAGSWTCQNGQCKAVQATPVVCKDNESRPCYTPTTGCTKQADGTYKCVGACKAGAQTCKANAWGVCTGEVAPASSEVCGNQIDDNCDGKTDDNCTCKAGETRPCYEASTGCTKEAEGKYTCTSPCKAGFQKCENNTWSACSEAVVPAKEICDDKIDNDCDGKIDAADDECGLIKCSDTIPCSGGLFCMRPSGKAEGYCLQSCDPTGAPCPNGLLCARARVGFGAFCLAVFPPQGPGIPCSLDELYKTCPRGQFCNPTSKLCENPTNNGRDGAPCGRNGDLCATGNLCLPSPAAARCTQICEGSPCSAGKTCTELKTPHLVTTRKLCLKTCASDSDCTGGSTREKCITLGHRVETGVFKSIKACVPAGVRKRWESCELFDENCEAGLRCFIPLKTYDLRPIGFCSNETCNGQPDCTPLPDASISTACKNVNCAACTGYFAPPASSDTKQCVITCVDNPAVCAKFGTFCAQPDPLQPKYCLP